MTRIWSTKAIVPSTPAIVLIMMAIVTSMRAIVVRITLFPFRNLNTNRLMCRKVQLNGIVGIVG